MNKEIRLNKHNVHTNLQEHNGQNIQQLHAEKK